MKAPRGTPFSQSMYKLLPQLKQQLALAQTFDRGTPFSQSMYKLLPQLKQQLALAQTFDRGVGRRWLLIIFPL